MIHDAYLSGTNPIQSNPHKVPQTIRDAKTI
jgi:hypothetical protein